MTAAFGTMQIQHQHMDQGIVITNDVEGAINRPLRLLVVEDNPSDAELMVRRLRNGGFDLDWVRVDDEESYLAALEEGYEMVLSDWSLPDFSGLRALEIVRERGIDIPFIILSGSIGEESAVQALHRGAADYLLKDRPERLVQAVRNALEQKRLRDERQQAENLLRLQSAALNAAANAIVITDDSGLIEWVNPAFTTLTGYTYAEAYGKRPGQLIRSFMQDAQFYEEMWGTIQRGCVWRGALINRRKDGQLYVEEMTITPVLDPHEQKNKYIAIKQDITERRRAEELVAKAGEELAEAYDATLQGWSNALELREHETAGHSRRVVQTTLSIARRMGVDEDRMVNLQRGALLHDIGKMGIPDNILLKPDKLTSDEWEIMRQHPIMAYGLLSKVPYLIPAMDIPLYHHERWNGSGYPKGLKGEEIPLAARIFAVVDVWDALTHARPYRRAWSSEETAQYIRENAGREFDPRIVEVFLGMLKEGEIGI